MRLFTALWPSGAAIRHLSSAVDAVAPDRLTEAAEGLRKFRFVPSSRWHLTLCFHGDDADPDEVGDRLERRIARLPQAEPPRTRLRSAGTFRGVLWIGTEETDLPAMRALVRAAGGDPHDYRGHMTIARWARGRPRGTLLPELFGDYTGPWWSTAEVCLVSSEQGEGGPVYRTVRRVALARP
ncbi:2'-5' RNA ligase family protein [Saccharopolyspora taberi]|uniref:RNA 2',3'-cyclic phosphodiesterase n=1 Tax=Saccharopolyspora taberi TaxID=60895 RepID=A0ABN3V800_9PSEU